MLWCLLHPLEPVAMQEHGEVVVRPLVRRTVTTVLVMPLREHAQDVRTTCGD
jgi:hypothetical protein